MEEFYKLNVGRVGAEVFLEEAVNGGFEHEGIVDCNHPDVWLLVPAWLSSASDAAVHDIVGDEEEGLEELGHPSQCCGLEVLFFVEWGLDEHGDGIGDRHSTIAFSADGVRIERLHILG